MCRAWKHASSMSRPSNCTASRPAEVKGWRKTESISVKVSQYLDHIQPRAALGVHREGGAALWQVGCQCRHACRVAASAQRIAQNQGVHRLWRQPDCLQQMPHQGRGQRVWCVMVQCAMTR